MKTIIGVVCGVIGMIVSVVIFLAGGMFGFLLNEWGTENKSKKDTPKCTDFDAHMFGNRGGE